MIFFLQLEVQPAAAPAPLHCSVRGLQTPRDSPWRQRRARKCTLKKVRGSFSLSLYHAQQWCGDAVLRSLSGL